MILVQNRQQQLSGNNILWVLVFLVFFNACSPKVIRRTSVKPGAKNETKAKEGDDAGISDPKTRTTVERKVSDKMYKVAVLMPFKSKSIQIATASALEIQSLDLAVDYYQGFMLGLKQALNSNIQLKVKVLDTEDNIEELKGYEKNGDLNQDLWIGPVFPSTIKFLSNYSKKNNALLLSPLSASSPMAFNNNHLISVMPNLAVHADKLVKEAVQNCKGLTNVNYVLISTSDVESLDFAKEVRNYFRKYNSGSQLIELTDVQQITQLKSNGSPYCIFVTTATRVKSVPVLNALGKFKDTNLGTIVKVYGHPNWPKQGYSLSISNKLNIHYTVASFHEPNDRQALQFENLYKQNYTLAPSEYAYNGYDVGVFLAKSLNSSDEAKFNPQGLKYNGLNTNFDFAYHEKYGYINLGLRIVEFANQKMMVK